MPCIPNSSIISSRIDEIQSPPMDPPFTISQSEQTPESLSFLNQMPELYSNVVNENVDNGSFLDTPLVSTLPMTAFQQFMMESKHVVIHSVQQVWQFLQPKWERYRDSTTDEIGLRLQLPAVMRQLIQSTTHNAANPMEFMLRNFDSNGDGHISRAELMNMTEIFEKLPPIIAPPHQVAVNWAVWFQREWPLMDWKIGVFLWSTFGGILLLLAAVSIIPGRLHGISAKILRWPVLAVVNFLIVVELM